MTCGNGDIHDWEENINYIYDQTDIWITTDRSFTKEEAIQLKEKLEEITKGLQSTADESRK